MVQMSENMRLAYTAGNILPPQQKRVRLYRFEEGTDTYTFLKEYDNMTQAGKDNGCTQGAVNKNCRKHRDALPKAHMHAKSDFFKVHVFRFSEFDDLEYPRV